MNFPMGFAGVGYPQPGWFARGAFPPFEGVAGQDEATALRDQAKYFEGALQSINERLNELESRGADDK